MPMPQDSTHPAPGYKPGAHVPVLDGFRGLAIFLVVCRHTSWRMDPTTPAAAAVYDLLRVGWVGVDLFFVLSGFLITGILVDSKGGEHYFRNFYVRRSLRIFPLYYGFLAVIFFVLPQILSYKPGGEAATLLGNQQWYWTYLVNVLVALEGEGAAPAFTTHLWSLAVEEQFYLVWPAVVLLCTRGQLRHVCAAMVVAALALRVVFVAALEGGNHAAYMLTPARMDSLAIGALVALAVREPDGLRRFVRWARPGALVAGLPVVVLFAVNGGLPSYDVAVQTIGYTAVACFAAALLGIVLASAPGTAVHRAFDHPGLRALGKYSYAIYVFHFPLLNAFRFVVPGNEVPTIWGSRIPGQLLVTGVVLAVSFVLAWLSWHLYEKQFLRLKRFFPTSAGRAPARATVWGRETVKGEA